MCSMELGSRRNPFRLSGAPEEKFVIGIIAGANRTRKHNLGFRAAEAQIIVLAPIKKEDSQIIKVSEALNVDYQDNISQLNSLYEKLKKDSRFKYVEKSERPSNRLCGIVRGFFV